MASTYGYHHPWSTIPLMRSMVQALSMRLGCLGCNLSHGQYWKPNRLHRTHKTYFKTSVTLILDLDHAIQSIAIWHASASFWNPNQGIVPTLQHSDHIRSHCRPPWCHIVPSWYRSNRQGYSLNPARCILSAEPVPLSSLQTRRPQVWSGHFVVSQTYHTPRSGTGAVHPVPTLDNFPASSRGMAWTHWPTPTMWPYTQGCRGNMVRLLSLAHPRQRDGLLVPLFASYFSLYRF